MAAERMVQVVSPDPYGAVRPQGDGEKTRTGNLRVGVRLPGGLRRLRRQEGNQQGNDKDRQPFVFIRTTNLKEFYNTYSTIF